MKNIIIQFRYTDKPRKEFIFPTDELISYIRLDRPMLKRFANDNGITINAFDEFCKDPVNNFNKYSDKGLCQVRIISYTSKDIVTDRTIDRLELARYYINNKDICELIEMQIRKDSAFLGRNDIYISDVSDINRIKKIKVDILRGINSM